MKNPTTWGEALSLTANVLKNADVRSAELLQHASSYEELLSFVKEADTARRTH